MAVVGVKTDKHCAIYKCNKYPTINIIVYTQLYRSAKDIEMDSPCIGTCTLNEQGICIGCNRTLKEIEEAGKDPPQKLTENA